MTSLQPYQVFLAMKSSPSPLNMRGKITLFKQRTTRCPYSSTSDSARNKTWPKKSYIKSDIKYYAMDKQSLSYFVKNKLQYLWKMWIKLLAWQKLLMWQVHRYVKKTQIEDTKSVIYTRKNQVRVNKWNNCKFLWQGLTSFPLCYTDTGIRQTFLDFWEICSRRICTMKIGYRVSFVLLLERHTGSRRVLKKWFK